MNDKHPQKLCFDGIPALLRSHSYDLGTDSESGCGNDVVMVNKKAPWGRKNRECQKVTITLTFWDILVRLITLW